MAKATADLEPTHADQVLERMTDILEQMQRNAPPNEPGFGHPEYQRRLREEGFFDEFPVPVFQNGKQAEPRGLKAETRARMADLKPGTYITGLVSVLREPNGTVHLQYRHSTMADQIKLSQHVRNFDDLIDQIWAEQTATPAA